ncbi:ATP-grasp domain-containing protein [Actinokineospora enzanensis]|uniref:ATP-grasp domain-containing protein n=1 Tax=Actinokineospora enzanensis TaxID=155975 RepID=UPI00035E6BF0|nr:ATP-grasp domain-containing protein [Actinokineospora enzanensis]
MSAAPRGLPAVVLSGVHSGPNPSPGLGLARSLRLAWPRLWLSALDYSPRATGLSATVFDRVHIRPGWDTADLAGLCSGLVSIVESSGAVFLPGLDLEAGLLATHHPGHPALLLPPAAAFALVVKPGVGAAELLGLSVPEYRRVGGIEEAAEFAAAHGWQVWVKGSRYQAVFATTRVELFNALGHIRATWGDEDVLVQRHIAGVEESVVFAALDGELLGARAMRKTMVTEEGKTWAGTVEPVRADGLRRVTEFARATRWTGGGEVEIVRDTRTGERYLLEVNPRFPAWVHGATLTGANLPARLVAAATGITQQGKEKAYASGFVRTVEEIPVTPRTAAVLTAAARVTPPVPASGKHPSEMPVLARRLVTPVPHAETGEPDEETARDVAAALPVDPGVSPARVLFPGALRRAMDVLTGVCQDVTHATGVRTRFAYSVKTNPDRRVLDTVLRRGALVEVISQSEAAFCADAGFPADHVVLTGPAKWWRFDGGPTKFGAVFCDSLTDLERTVDLVGRGLVHTDVLGLRLAPSDLTSRFGVDVTHPVTYRRVADALRAAAVSRLGLHFHHAASRIGPRVWLREFTAAITVAADLCARTDTRVSCVDLGGGWVPGTSRAVLGGLLGRAARVAVRELGPLEEILFEPGKFLVERAMAVFATVLDVREDPSGRAAVVDASVAELPDWVTHPHRVLWRRRGGSWRRLGPGDEVILGRLCMEHDQPREGVALPAALAPGDHVLFLDAGAYDAGMSYRFGVRP